MKRILPKNCERICAYVFADGIVFKFTAVATVGKARIEKELYAIVRKKIYMRERKQWRSKEDLVFGDKGLPPILISDIQPSGHHSGFPEGIMLGIKRVEWYPKMKDIDVSVESLHLSFDTSYGVLDTDHYKYENCSWRGGPCLLDSWSERSVDEYVKHVSSDSIYKDITVEET